LGKVNLRLRFSLLFLILFGGLLLSLYGIDRWQKTHQNDIARSETTERETLLRELVKLETETGRHFADDYSQWDEMLEFVAKPTPKWAEVNIDGSMEDFKINCAWVLSPTGTVLYNACWPDKGEANSTLLELTELQALLRRPTFDFFVTKGGKVYEVHGGAIVPSDDSERTKPSVGHLLIAKEWDRDRLVALEPITQGNLLLSPVPDRASLPANLAALALPGPNGTPVAWLGLQYSSQELEQIEAQDTYELIVVAIIGFIALLAFWSCLQRWVLQPLNLIRESIARDDDDILAPLQAKRDEIGLLALLVGEAQDQRLLLREALDERVRLGRDLHDGAIQKIYSFGMNMASARGLLRTDPAAADKMLGQSLSVVNEVIGELRTFIHRLEPEPTANRRMSAVFRALLEPAGPKMHTEVKIDDAVADRLDPRQRSHLMFFASEAISNALRHSHAKTLRVSLQAEGGGALLEVADDGVGFDPAKVPDGRQGQRNLAARARELRARLQVQSTPGSGTTIILHLPAESLTSGPAPVL
jgi:signal transduction histidine kinase